MPIVETHNCVASSLSLFFALISSGRLPRKVHVREKLRVTHPRNSPISLRCEFVLWVQSIFLYVYFSERLRETGSGEGLYYLFLI